MVRKTRSIDEERMDERVLGGRDAAGACLTDLETFAFAFFQVYEARRGFVERAASANWYREDLVRTLQCCFRSASDSLVIWLLRQNATKRA